jgi:hypothetical protein
MCKMTDGAFGCVQHLVAMSCRFVLRKGIISLLFLRRIVLRAYNIPHASILGSRTTSKQW